MTQSSLEARVQELEDREAITRLMSLYCFHADNQDGESWSNVFSEDGIFESDLLGAVQGRAAIAAWQHRSFAIHYNSNPIIEIDGDTAFARWLLFMPCSFGPEGDKRAVWAGCRYENELVRIDGRWLFRKVKLISLMWTPFDRGWELERVIAD